MSDDPRTSSRPSAPEDASDQRLPFSAWWPLLAGVAAGIGLRVAFYGEPGGIYAPMSGAFIYLAPVVVGAVTVYVAERKKRRTWRYYIWAPFLADILFVLGTLFVMIEGLICAVIIAPLFALLGIVGGLIMGAVCRVTKWPRQTLLGIGILPFVLGPIEDGMPLPALVGAVERTVVMDAPPGEIWRQIMNAEAIQPAELDRAWVFRIGVPLPLAGVTRQGPNGMARRVTMGKQVYFDEVITQSEENRYVRWAYRFYEDSFPPYALDEHVVIGGHYFDLVDTSYTLSPVGDRTQVRMRTQYRVSTRFNWYADPVAQFLLGNVQEVNLNFYRERSSGQAREEKP
jgi:hypothetical protein